MDSKPWSYHSSVAWMPIIIVQVYAIDDGDPASLGPAAASEVGASVGPAVSAFDVSAAAASVGGNGAMDPSTGAASVESASLPGGGDGISAPASVAPRESIPLVSGGGDELHPDRAIANCS